MKPPTSQPRHNPARIHPNACRFCNGQSFWKLYDGPVHSSGVDRDDKHFSTWSYHFAVRCMQCHATFHAESGNQQDDGNQLAWHLGKGFGSR
jgi:hypothetical protein